MSPTLSVVIPVLGEQDRLARCLAALFGALAPLAPGEAEVVVADDGTPGGLSPELSARFDGVRWLEATQRTGFGANVNRAVRECRGRIVCLLNSDMYVARDFFRDYARPFEDDALFAICPRIREPGGVNAGQKQLALSPRGAVVRFAQDSDPASDQPTRVAYANGGGGIFRKDHFLALGGFDPVFLPYYWEDTDLGYRAWKRGLVIAYDPRRALDHDHQGTIAREGRRRVSRVKARNERQFLWRNLTGTTLAALVWRGTLPELLSDLAALRLRRVGWALSDLRLLGRAARQRSRARGDERRSDAEVARLLGDRLLLRE